MREKIYRHLQQHPRGSNAETIASQLFLTKGTVMRHLKALVEQDLVTCFGREHHGICYRTTASTERKP